MRVTRDYCDRCGKEIQMMNDLWQVTVEPKFEGASGGPWIKGRDLCAYCATLVRDMVEKVGGRG